jgi:hypothetical protein
LDGIPAKDRGTQTAFQTSNKVNPWFDGVGSTRFFPMATEEKGGFIKAFWDFFVLFSGISTASNLARTQGRSLRTGGLFLFRRPADKPTAPQPGPR